MRVSGGEKWTISELRSIGPTSTLTQAINNLSACDNWIKIAGLSLSWNLPFRKGVFMTTTKFVDSILGEGGRAMQSSAVITAPAREPGDLTNRPGFAYSLFGLTVVCDALNLPMKRAHCFPSSHSGCLAVR